MRVVVGVWCVYGWRWFERLWGVVCEVLFVMKWFCGFVMFCMSFFIDVVDVDECGICWEWDNMSMVNVMDVFCFFLVIIYDGWYGFFILLYEGVCFYGYCCIYVFEECFFRVNLGWVWLVFYLIDFGIILVFFWI